jgi:hypothetical protein
MLENVNTQQLSDTYRKNGYKLYSPLMALWKKNGGCQR